MIHDVAWLQERHDWPGLRGVVVVDSERFIDGKIQRETRLYITSLVLLANLVGPMIRSHWAVENSLHWIMDMMFRDDECRSEPPTRRPISRRFDIWRKTYIESPRQKTRCA
jgi:hypothetical protein